MHVTGREVMSQSRDDIITFSTENPSAPFAFDIHVSPLLPQRARILDMPTGLQRRRANVFGPTSGFEIFSQYHAAFALHFYIPLFRHTIHTSESRTTSTPSHTQRSPSPDIATARKSIGLYLTPRDNVMHPRDIIVVHVQWASVHGTHRQCLSRLISQSSRSHDKRLLLVPFSCEDAPASSYPLRGQQEPTRAS